jgi:hypothetical protein
MFFTAVSVFSQTVQPVSETSDKQASAPAANDAAPQPKEMSIYGEVQSVNPESGVLSVQYYDYDSDSEKTAEVSVSNDTKLENAKSVGDIKKGDWADVTYSVSAGKNIAKMISVEKEEPVAEAADAAAAANVPSEE